MLLARACLGLTIAQVSAQQYSDGSVPLQADYMQVPEMQEQQMMYEQQPDIQMMPDMQAMPDMQTYQPMPDIQMMPDLQFEQQQRAPPAKPDDGSEECSAFQQMNPLHSGMSVLQEGRAYCSQAADSRWWDVVVKHRNCDGSYFVVVKDDVGTEWPAAQRAYFLDKPCNDFYREVLMEEGLSEQEIQQTLQSQGFKEDEQPQQVQYVQAEQPQAQADQVPPANMYAAATQQAAPAKSRWPVASDRKIPLKIVAAAAAAGAVPLVYGLSGSGA